MAWNHRARMAIILGAFFLVSVVIVVAALVRSTKDCRDRKSAEVGCLVVSQRIELSDGSLRYPEGSRSFVMLNEGGPDQTWELEGDAGMKSVAIPLRAGSYGLTSFQRPCDGDCEHLDPPTDDCTTTVKVEAATQVAVLVMVRPGSGCSITLQA